MLLISISRTYISDLIEKYRLLLFRHISFVIFYKSMFSIIRKPHINILQTNIAGFLEEYICMVGRKSVLIYQRVLRQVQRVLFCRRNGKLQLLHFMVHMERLYYDRNYLILTAFLRCSCWPPLHLSKCETNSKARSWRVRGYFMPKPILHSL